MAFERLYLLDNSGMGHIESLRRPRVATGLSDQVKGAKTVESGYLFPIHM